METPSLLVMAAGMGSRYGGLKQMDPVGSAGESLLDFSVYDAKLSGFGKVYFVIKDEISDIFKEKIGRKIAKHFPVDYIYQRMEDIPAPFTVPQGREKPWGTGHAVYAGRNQIREPFAVINADDFYGRDAFRILAGYLKKGTRNSAMVSYRLENTLTDNGFVSRGICTVENNCLQNVEERTHIEKRHGRICFMENDIWTPIREDCPVSMNMWGFDPGFFDVLTKSFQNFLEHSVAENPMKAEFYLPKAVNDSIRLNHASVFVLKTTEKWYGVTYQQDKEIVKRELQYKKDQGIYPQDLWE